MADRFKSYNVNTQRLDVVAELFCLLAVNDYHD